jgi:hypothetical protein
MEVSGQLHDPAALSLGKIAPDTHRIGDWVGPRSSGAVEKIRLTHAREHMSRLFNPP